MLVISIHGATKMNSFTPPSSISGFTMLEVLISILVIALGLLGLAGLQMRMQQAEFESYERSQAVVLLYDIVERVHANKAAASCFAFTTNATTGSPYVGTGANAPTGCAGTGTAASNAMADSAIAEWDSLLDGAAEVSSGGSSVGGIVGARGCVSYGGTSTEIVSGGTPVSGTGIYTATVSWQGNTDTVAPSANCGNGQYGAETKRRAISTTFRIANLD